METANNKKLSELQTEYSAKCNAFAELSEDTDPEVAKREKETIDLLAQKIDLLKNQMIFEEIKEKPVAVENHAEQVNLKQIGEEAATREKSLSQRQPVFDEEIADGISDLVNKGVAEISLESMQIFDATNAVSTTTQTVPDGENEVFLTRRNIPVIRRPLTLLDGVRVTPTNVSTVRLPAERSSRATNGAAVRAEGSAFAESNFQAVVLDRAIESVGTYLTITREMLNDPERAYAVSFLRAKLASNIRVKLEDELIKGAGGAGKITGILNESGIGTQTYENDLSSSPSVDADDVAYNLWAAISSALTSVVVDGFANPTFIALHPQRISEMRVARDSNGRPFFNFNPQLNSGRSGAIFLHGYPVLQSQGLDATVAASGTAGFVMDTAHHDLFVKPSMRVEITQGLKSDDFIKNQTTVLGQIYATSFVSRPKAVVAVKGD